LNVCERLWGYNPVQDDWSDVAQSRPLHGDIGPHVLRTLVLLRENLLGHDVYVYLERPLGALPPEVVSPFDGRVVDHVRETKPKFLK